MTKHKTKTAMCRGCNIRMVKTEMIREGRSWRCRDCTGEMSGIIG